MAAATAPGPAGMPAGEAMPEEPLVAGEAVRAFYHMNGHPGGYRYVRLPNGPPEEAPEDSAAVGLSTGWVPATVAEDWRPDSPNDAGDERVLVRLHGRFADAYNQDPEPVHGMYWRVKRSHVRRMGSPQPPAELSLLVVRWWDYWNPKNKRSKTHNVANEDMILDVLEGPASPHTAFAESGTYEVHSAFIRSTSDLEMVGRTMVASMRGRRRVGLYFLWPTQRPIVERRLAGAVAEPALLALMERMEAAGVRGCWPHAPVLYRELAGKLWVPRTSCGRPDLRVPPTVRLDVKRWLADPYSAAEEAIAELQRLRVQTPHGREPLQGEYRGIVKLGFSWMGEDVRPFTGAAELVKVLRQFLDSAQPDTVCLVQERIENVACELRLVCFRDLAAGPEAMKKELVRMRLHPPRHSNDETFSLTSHLTMSPAEACDYAFRGSKEALKAAENEATRLADLWLQWFRQEGYGTPAACRLDFLITVADPRGGSGVPDVAAWTVELCECGGSLCGLNPVARAAACLNECILEDDAGRFPKPLPPLQAEHRPADGSKATASSRGATRGSLVPSGSGRSSSALARRPGFKLLAFLAALLLLWLRLRRR